MSATTAEPVASRLEPHPATAPTEGRQIALVDLLDRLLGTGVVLAGDIVISLAGVDLVQVRLHALVTSVRAEMAASAGAGPAETR